MKQKAQIKVNQRGNIEIHRGTSMISLEPEELKRLVEVSPKFIEEANKIRNLQTTFSDLEL